VTALPLFDVSLVNSAEMRDAAPELPRHLRLREVRAEIIRDIHRTTPAGVTIREWADSIRNFFQLADDPQENLVAVFIDSRNRPIAASRLYRGTVNSATVSTRDVATGALLSNAAGVIVAHNHPSGDPSPSAEDLLYTRKLREALALLNIELADHIVIAAKSHYSMHEKGML
jgi:DNA repair protein RadC